MFEIELLLFVRFTLPGRKPKDFFPLASSSNMQKGKKSQNRNTLARSHTRVLSALILHHTKTSIVLLVDPPLDSTSTSTSTSTLVYDFRGTMSMLML